MRKYCKTTITGRLQAELSGPPREEMIKTPSLPEIIVLHLEKDIRLRIDLLEGQSSFIANMVTRAISEHNEVVFAEYAKRLAVNRGRIEELLWVLGENNTAGQSMLDIQVTSKNNEIILTVRDIIEKLRKGELRMDDLSTDTQSMVRKAHWR